jgi:hypothetical protein
MTASQPLNEAYTGGRSNVSRFVADVRTRVASLKTKRDPHASCLPAPLRSASSIIGLALLPMVRQRKHAFAVAAFFDMRV